MDRNEIEFRKRVSNGENIRDILESADEQILSNRGIMKYATLEWRGAFKYASGELKKDKTFVMEFLNSNYSDFPLEYAAPEVRTDEELLLQIAKRDPRSLAGADRSVLDDKEFMKKVVAISPIPFAYSMLSSDKEFVEEIVGINGEALAYADENLHEDRQLLMKAVKNNPEAINKIGISSHYLSQYLEDEELLLEAAKSMALREGSVGFSFDISKEMHEKIFENKKVNELYDEYWNNRRKELQSKEKELSSLEAEEKTIKETEALIDKQTQKEGQDIGEN